MDGDRETYRTTLRRALLVAGGGLQLSVRLQVSPAQLDRWLLGTDPIPARAFLDAVDIITKPDGNTRSALGFAGLLPAHAEERQVV